MFLYKKLLLFGSRYPNIGIKPGRRNSHQSETNLIKTPEAILPGAPLGFEVRRLRGKKLSQNQ
jgi:hypothetical protein